MYMYLHSANLTVVCCCVRFLQLDLVYYHCMYYMVKVEMSQLSVRHSFLFICYEGFPFSSDRQHLNYDDCLEVRGEIIRTVMCCIVY